jgi:hypothetical protein
MLPELEERIEKFTKRYQKHKEVNLATLEEDWVKQTGLMSEACQIQALLKKELAYVEADLEVAEADAKFRIRKNPTKYGLDKATDNPVKEAMILHPLYQKANKKVIEAKFAVDMIGGCIATLEHRKRTLEGLVSLYGQQYFAKPTVPQDAVRQFKDKVDSAPYRRKKKSGK